MSFERWDDPRLRRIGKKFRADAYNMAHDLDGYGADVLAWLMTDEQRDHRAKRMNYQIRIPVAFADALMALLLSLPRTGNKPGRRPLWSIEEAQKLVNSGMSKRKVAQMLSKETGLPAENIRRRLHSKKAGPIAPDCTENESGRKRTPERAAGS
jgi:hypothetical protein